MVPQRIKIFIWLVSHDKLMHNVNRMKRGFTNNLSCLICDSEQEDLDHIFRRCLIARMIWQNHRRSGNGLKGFDGSTLDWVRANLKDVQRDHSWPAKFAITLWYLWKRRNEGVFNRAQGIPENRTPFLEKRFTDIFQALKGDNFVLGSRNYRGRTAPPYNWVPLNTDGAAKGNPGSAGGGGVFRSHRGEWLGGFAENIGCCTSTKAELKAVLRGLKLARTLGFTKLWVNLDSSCVVGFIRGAFNLPIEHWNLIKQCRELIADPS